MKTTCMNLIGQTGLGQTMDLLCREFDELGKALEPLELGEVGQDELDWADAMVIKFRLASEILLKKAQDLETVAQMKIGQIYAEMGGPEE